MPWLAGFRPRRRVGVEGALQEVLASDEKQFSEDWKAAIRAAYGPVIEGRQTPSALGRRLVPTEEKTIDNYVSPVLSPDGTQFAVFSTRSLFSFELYLGDAKTGRITGKLLSEDADPHLDSLRFLDSAGAWSPDGAKFAVVVQTKGDNELAILDVRSRRIERQIGIPEAGQLWNPAWSPDGRSIAVAGSVGGWTDLFVVDLGSGSSRRLTNDAYSELQPDGRRTARAWPSSPTAPPAAIPATGATRDVGIWQMDLASGESRQLVAPMSGATQINPRFGPGGRDLYFLSDRAGVSDLYRLSLGSNELFRVTRAVTGVTGITRLSPGLSVSQQTGDVLVSVFTDERYEIHALDAQAAKGELVVAAPDEAAEARAALLPPQQTATRSLVTEYLQERFLPPQPAGKTPEEQAYKPRFRLDWIGPSVGVGYSNTYGSSVGGDVAAIFSDELGQREIGFALQGQTGTLDEFGFQAYFLNLSRRFNWGAEASHIPYLSGFTSVTNGTADIDGTLVPATIIQQELDTITEDRVGPDHPVPVLLHPAPGSLARASPTSASRAGWRR